MAKSAIQLRIWPPRVNIALPKKFSKRTLEQWEKTIRVVLTGQYIVAREVIPYMKNAKKGVIVCMSSSSGSNSYSPECPDYDSAKAGVKALSQILAKELAPHGIRVNALAPGWVNTEMNAELPEDYVKDETERIYLKRFAEPEEIANVVLFLCGDEASYVNGTTIFVTGGYE